MNSATYREIIENCFPALQVRDIAVVAEGWDSCAVEVNGQLIFRFPKRPEVEDQYAKEALLLPALAQATSLPVPQIEFVWPGGPAYEKRFIGHRKLTGLPLACDWNAAGRTAQLARQIAAVLSELHGFPITRAAELRVPAAQPNEWRGQYQGLYDQVQRGVLPLLDVALRSWAAALWSRFLADEQNFQFRPALLHHDLTTNHILCDSRGISGVIDWGDAAVGDPAIDFAGLLHDCGARFTEHVLAAYTGPLDASFWRRVHFYASIVPFHEVLFGLSTGLQRHVEEGLRQLISQAPTHDQ